MTRVLSAPLFDPGMARTETEMPEGLTLAEIVAEALPGLPDGDRAQLRVTLVTREGAAVIEARYWAQVRPREGVRVVIRLVPGNEGGLRSVLLAVVSIAALALAQPVAGLLFGSAATSTQISLTALGLNLIGSALVNALVPVEVPEQEKRRNRYTLQGWSNTLRPDDPVPWVAGRHRYAPPYAARPYTEIVGDEQYTRVLFGFGPGRLDISDLKIGDTPIEEFDEIETEIREGVEGDDPVTLYPRQVLEERAGVELTRPLPRDDGGEIIDGASLETPVVRVTADNTQIISLIFWFPSGLIRFNRENDPKPLGVSLRIRHRQGDGDPWEEIDTLDFLAEKEEPFFRQYSWQPPSRGRWQVEVTRMTDERTNTRYRDRVMLASVQSVRPEYPLDVDVPQALVAMRARATYQLNGQVDTFNAVVQRYAPDWDGTNWSDALSRNPASVFVAALQSPASVYPVPDVEIDWEIMQDWHEFCAAKGLQYDRVHEDEQSLGDALRQIAAAGRARPRHDGVKWGVVIDRPEAQVVDHIDTRNSSDFRWSRQYLDPPDALRVPFNDATRDHEPAVRIIPRPGYEGPIRVTEEFRFPGKTDPAEIWIEGRRRWYEILHRPDTYSCMQDGAARVVTRGDQVIGAWDVLDETVLVARVKSVDGALVEIDEDLTMPEGAAYGMRFRVFADAEDSIGSSVVASLLWAAGPTRAFAITGTEDRPRVGEVVHIGPTSTESRALRVTDIEPGEDFSARLTMVDAAPEIDELTDAEVPPPWDGTVGSSIALALPAPLTPRILGVDSSTYYSPFSPISGAPDAELSLNVRLAPGEGETGYLASFELDHRLQGATPWTTVTVPVATGGSEITGYADGEILELRARALGVDGTAGSYTPTVTHTVGTGAVEQPDDLETQAISASGGLGHAAISIAVPAGGTTQVQLYRVPAGDTLDTDLHAVGDPVAVTAGTTVTVIDGDATRDTLLANGYFDADTDWSKGLGWTIGAGVASGAPPAASELSQALSLTEGDVLRLAWTVPGYVGGSVTPQLTGGTTASGSAVSAAGRHFDELTVASGNTDFALAKDGSFEGSVDAVTLYLRTAACAPQGDWDYYAEPLNDTGQAASIAGPANTEIA
ncbi:TipJ family phage tail tip protein [Salipiger mucosus]|uniref:Tip attachment protein J HDII-ins2 domain-containing protein n=1 Tax=Salipiger mucosus DSM 16094 TaxID=1123237 RepID=S9QR55_9RHOB|nr:hypothetical protein [Salipiger mucosus]EPX82107.1 hypothetical protein Salmuc_02475 [Salipiger mucosus DSM 16094]